MDNFEKSEFIRNQQKTLIQSLKNEIEKLKSNQTNNFEPLKETNKNQSTKGKKKKSLLH